jgi:hypothetical protein
VVGPRDHTDRFTHWVRRGRSREPEAQETL